MKLQTGAATLSVDVHIPAYVFNRSDSWDGIRVYYGYKHTFTTATAHWSSALYAPMFCQFDYWLLGQDFIYLSLPLTRHTFRLRRAPWHPDQSYDRMSSCCNHPLGYILYFLYAHAYNLRVQSMQGYKNPAVRVQCVHTILVHCTWTLYYTYTSSISCLRFKISEKLWKVYECILFKALPLQTYKLRHASFGCCVLSHRLTVMQGSHQTW